jgi:uncharacterized protein (DUF362 family)
MTQETKAAAIVSVTRCADYESGRVEAALAGNLSGLGGMEQFVRQGEQVLLKPNFIAAKRRDQAVQTDPAVLLAVAKTVKDLGGKPFIADSPAWNNVKSCIKALALEEPLRKLGVDYREMDEPQRVLIDGTKVGIGRAALEADKIINLPKLKSHQQLTATFAVKNMFGCVCGKEKAWWHFARGKEPEKFCRLLIGIYKLLRPVLNIIDGVVAMEGPGPIRGKPRRLGYLVSGIDPIACERVCCDLIQIDPEALPILQTAKRIGFGCGDPDRIQVVGDAGLNKACADFQAAELVPIRFSLVHVIRSVIRQIMLLAKTKKQGGTTGKTGG